MVQGVRIVDCMRFAKDNWVRHGGRRSGWNTDCSGHRFDRIRYYGGNQENPCKN